MHTGFAPPRAPRPLETYTIYHDPTDYPGRYVVRRFVVAAGHPIPDLTPIIVTTSRLEARNAIPRGLTCFPRDPTDEPAIVETWL
jgi:hypothetical protein